MSKSTYKYILIDGDEYLEFERNYDLSDHLGVKLERTHNEQNWYETFAQWSPYPAGEWKFAFKYKDKLIFRIKK